MHKANTSFFVNNRLVSDGDLVADDDPIITGREHLFDRVNATVEEATAVPGVKRTAKRTAKKISE